MLNPVVAPLKHTIDLNTRLVLNALEGLSETDVLERPRGAAPANHIAFLLCHLVDTRHYLLNALGGESKCPFEELEGAKRLDDIASFPSLEAMRDAWTRVSAELSTHLETLDDAALARATESTFPIERGDTHLGMLGFLVQHDSFHLGQIALIRRLLAKPPMSYA